MKRIDQSLAASGNADAGFPILEQVFQIKDETAKMPGIIDGVRWNADRDGDLHVASLDAAWTRRPGRRSRSRQQILVPDAKRIGNSGQRKLEQRLAAFCVLDRFP